MNPKAKPVNPFIQLLGLVSGVIFFATAVLLGGIMLAAIIGFVLIAVLVMYVRVWWLTRKGLGRRRPGAAADATFVEAEYQVINNDEDKDPRQ